MREILQSLRALYQRLSLRHLVIRWRRDHFLFRLFRNRLFFPNRLFFFLFFGADLYTE